MGTKSSIDVWELERVAKSWLGTPFAAHCAMRGVGVDCVHLVAEIYQRLGIISSYQFPDYTLDGGHHAAQSPVDTYVADTGCFAAVPVPDSPEAIIPGDLITLRVGRLPWHCGIALANARLIHAMHPRGVIESTLADPTYWRRVTGVFRPK